MGGTLCGLPRLPSWAQVLVDLLDRLSTLPVLPRRPMHRRCHAYQRCIPAQAAEDELLVDGGARQYVVLDGTGASVGAVWGAWQLSRLLVSLQSSSRALLPAGHSHPSVHSPWAARVPTCLPAKPLVALPACYTYVQFAQIRALPGSPRAFTWGGTSAPFSFTSDGPCLLLPRPFQAGDGPTSPSPVPSPLPADLLHLNR